MQSAVNRLTVATAAAVLLAALLSLGAQFASAQHGAAPYAVGSSVPNMVSFPDRVLANGVTIQPASAAPALTTWHVTTLSDRNNPVCLPADCSLREAIAAANLSSGDSIDFVVTGTIVLSASLGQLNISSPLSIAGPGVSKLTIDGGHAARIFNISASATISGLTIYNGYPSDSNGGGGVFVASGALTLTNSTLVSNSLCYGCGHGAGIYLSTGTLYISNSLIALNAVSAISGNGGGLYQAAGTATIVNSTFFSNSSGYNHQGAGIYKAAGMLTIAGSTFSGNNAGYGNGGGINNSAGALTVDHSVFVTNTAAAAAAIENAGSMTVTNSSFVSNTVSYIVGGIRNFGTATLLSVTVESNTATLLPGGGGIANTGSMTVRFSTIRDNMILNGAGAGIYNSGQLTVTNSTVSGNAANGAGSKGAGIYNSGQLSVTNSTVSGNHSPASGSEGSGIYTEMTSTVNLNFVTVANNASGTGGGLVANNSTGIVTGPATINFRNTIVGGNTTTGSGPDCIALSGGTLNVQDYDLIQNISGCTLNGLNGTDLTGQNPRLSPLQNHGGATPTHGLLIGSPASDQIPNGVNGCGTTVTIDQRGFLRPDAANGPCDLGAFEGTLYLLYLPLVKR